MRKWSRVISFVIMAFILFSCGKSKMPFTLLSHKKTGITFRNAIQETESFNHLEYSYLYNGGGVAIGDINNDGLADLYFSGNLVKSRLYLNQGNFRFKDITEMAGVSAAETWNNGVAMADINGDGFLDIYLCSSTDGRPRFRKNLLFINNGDLTFSNQAEIFGVEDPAYSTHSAFLDYDKDGDLDLFVINHSLDRFAMFDERAPGLRQEENPKYGHKLFRNEGGTFSEVTKDAGILSNAINFGLGIAVSDFNNDHWPDIYVCNDYFERDYFYINQQDGTFLEQLEQYFNHISFSSMGNDAADINNDGFIDLITLDMLPNNNREQKLVEGPHNYAKFKLLETRGFYNQTTRNMLHLNAYGSHFTEIGQFAGIQSTNWSWAPLFCDFDNNGTKDLFISNGYGKNNTHMDVIMLLVQDAHNQQRGVQGLSDMEVIDQVPATILQNYMFRNNGDLTFSNVSKEWGFGQKTLSNGAAYGDLDNDGDVDLVINNINDYAFVYRNNAIELTSNHYLRIKLKGNGLNTSGIGARIDLKCGDHTYTQEQSPSRGYMSSVDYVLVFGLGEATFVDTLRITWPDQKWQELLNLPVDQTITLDQADAKDAYQKTTSIEKTVLTSWHQDKPIHFKHIENKYNDFEKQPLLPYLLSTQGPRIATGDVNKDGLEDVFVGGSKGNPGKLYMQSRDENFEFKTMQCFVDDQSKEDIGSLFLDVDGDADLDLYVVSGGNEFNSGSSDLQDRLYLNDGTGGFKKSENYLPVMPTSGSCVRGADIDQDGDMDLFVGGRLSTTRYPIAPRSYILENDGTGHFTDKTENRNKDLLFPGMVTDALFSDFNGDSLIDLILVGEWMPVRIFLNQNSTFLEVEGQDWMAHSKGYWHTISQGDFDLDGDPDFVLGNLGLNFQIKPTPIAPVTMYASDFDNNGSMDGVMCFNQNGKNYPIYSRDDLMAQIPGISEMYPNYGAYADRSITDIFSKEQLDTAMVLEINTYASSYLENLGNSQFTLSELPFEAQWSPLYSIVRGDYNKDGNPDLILSGNFFGSRIKYGRFDANRGVLLYGNGKGDFAYISNNKSGLDLRGEVRDMAKIRQASGKDVLFFATNNDSLQIYTFQ